MNIPLSAVGPKVSIVVPNYNHAKFLERRFESIFTQTFQDFEIIFLDDASRDDSLKVFERFSGHPRLSRCIVNEKNTGSPYKQWNRGAREARGRYLWIAESDDYADPLFLERMVAMLDAHPSVGIAFCKSNKVDEHARPIGTTDDWLAELGPRWSADFVAPGRRECGADLMRRCVIPNVSSAVIRLETLVQVGYAHEAMRYCGDYLTYAKLLEISDLAYVATPLNYFRFSSQTMRTKMSHSWLHELERARTMAFVQMHFPLARAEQELAGSGYLETLIRLAVRDRRFAWNLLTRMGAFREASQPFCPNFIATLLQVVSRILRRRVVERLS
jgi:glycosyltransferase involved in cell wall biosynthesis